MPVKSRKTEHEAQQVLKKLVGHGKMIQATIFKAYIKQFSEALSVNDVYYLSNARILKIPQEYRLVDNDYQIIFTGELL
ncbi:hypothetical protein QJS10_CPB11g00799 [Acorus calamus]|uniref:Replication protein A 70 kDa DNA-binding subunit B/D first OB fold domain-containing protein n=1 Tax=Acorus calamus TaxID=4465 RepID=A0AAV9DT73_ACOCL|nr:hypothetical protein QJS10_CPB11g00799 [Acorus calamus]